jgi:hypothetical protein
MISIQSLLEFLGAMTRPLSINLKLGSTQGVRNGKQQSLDPRRVVGVLARDSSLSLFTRVKTRPSHITEGLGMTMNGELKEWP